MNLQGPLRSGTPRPALQDRVLRAPGSAHAHRRRGIALLISALLILPVMDAIAKLLSRHLPVLEVVWGRFAVYALLITPLALVRHGKGAWRVPHLGLQLLRGVLLASTAFMFFSAIAHMPLADAMAIFFVYPFIILTASAALLRERIGRAQWLLVALGFVGALLIIRPGQGGGSGWPYSLWAVGTGAAYASALLVTRRLAGHSPAFVTSAFSALAGVVMFTPWIPLVWQSPRALDWLLIALMGSFAALGHLLIIVAHRHASAAELAPYGYTELASAVLMGWWLFGDLPQPAVWLGAAMIVGSGLLGLR